jgi:hypothetical protein
MAMSEIKEVIPPRFRKALPHGDVDRDLTMPFVHPDEMGAEH